MLSLGKQDLIKKEEQKKEKKLKVLKRLQQDKEFKPYEYYPPGFIKQDPVKMLESLKQRNVMPLQVNKNEEKQIDKTLPSLIEDLALDSKPLFAPL